MTGDASVSNEARGASSSSALEFARGLVELSKPGITRMVALTTLLGVVAAPLPVRYGVLGGAVAGTALVVAGANALNMFLERDSDRFMTRTSSRPLPSGRMSPEVALAFGVLVSMLGLAVLAEMTTMLAVLLAAFALLGYVLVYTPMKRLTPAALYVGAVPGAMPPAIGYAAAKGDLDRVAISLFLILLVWQLPHFLAISLFRKEEYERASLAVFPNRIGVWRSKQLTVLLALALFVVTLLPVLLGFAGVPYALVAVASGASFLGYALRGLYAKDEVAWAKRLFFASMPHLVLVFTVFVASVP